MKDIDTAELFKDIQVSMTEVMLIELLPDGEYAERREGNLEIIRIIKGILRKRFSDSEIQEFLDGGYPRRVP